MRVEKQRKRLEKRHRIVTNVNSQGDRFWKVQSRLSLWIWEDCQTVNRDRMQELEIHYPLIWKTLIFDSLEEAKEFRDTLIQKKLDLWLDAHCWERVDLND